MSQKENTKRRNTKSKLEVLSILKSFSNGLSYDDIHANIVTDIDRATIYRILNRLYEDGVVHKVVGDDGKNYFALCKDSCSVDKKHNHRHFHFRCIDCGVFECLNELDSISMPEGYRVESYNLVVTGVCKECS